MPIYQYACTECGEELEARQSFTDDALTVCPVCAGRLRKVLNAVGVVFKGSGFYRTDSRTEARGSSGRDGQDGTSAPDAAKTGADRGDGPSSGSDKPAANGSSGEPKSGNRRSGERQSGERQAGERQAGERQAGERQSGEPRSPAKGTGGSSRGSTTAPRGRPSTPAASTG